MFTFFAKKTVASVLTAFNKAISDLENVEQHHAAEATRHAEIIVEAQANHDASIREASMARDVIGKLQSVITPAIPLLGASNLIGLEGSGK